jgi:hypothetical protein
MGFFSWMTADKPHESIPNTHSSRPTFPVKMLDDKGNEYLCDAYNGYGDFSGADYYALADKMNGGNGDRDRGIDLAYGDDNVPLPKIVRAGCKTRYEDLPNNKDCPNQGYFY